MKALEANLKSETMKLIDLRTSMETKMNVIINTLCQPDGPGLRDNLMDAEGFPRNDIDISNIKEQRQRLIVLRNDHREITERINNNICALHSATIPNDSTCNPGKVDASDKDADNHLVPSVVAETGSDTINNVPFAVITEITDASPAAEDGLQLGDQILKFGKVEFLPDADPIQNLAYEVQITQNTAVPARVMRNGRVINLMVTPRTWIGRGTLGYGTFISPRIYWHYLFHFEVVAFLYKALTNSLNVLLPNTQPF